MKKLVLNVMAAIVLLSFGFVGTGTVTALENPPQLNEELPSEH